MTTSKPLNQLNSDIQTIAAEALCVGQIDGKEELTFAVPDIREALRRAWEAGRLAGIRECSTPLLGITCRTCNGTGEYKSGCHRNPCPACGGEGTE